VAAVVAVEKTLQLLARLAVRVLSFFDILLPLQLRLVQDLLERLLLMAISRSARLLLVQGM
jgi:hypothetical protein